MLCFFMHSSFWAIISRRRRLMKTDRRFKQAGFEALCSVVLAVLFFVWWYVFAYGLGSGDPAQYRFVMGFPEWFFYSSIAGPIIFCFAAWLMVKFLFKEVSLVPHEDKGGNGNAD